MVNNEIKETFKKVSLNYIGNSNSLHKLGLDSKKLENAATKQIEQILNLKDKEIIYTSSREESNSLAILGYISNHKNKNIIAFSNCDISILETLDFLNKYNVTTKVINDIDSLKENIDNDTILICTSNKDDIKLINKEIKESNKIKVLLDITNNFNINFDFNSCDFISFDYQSCNSIEGIGCLIKSKNIELEPLFHGGDSTTIYRSGTPALPLIVSFSKALNLMNKNK